MFSSLYSSQYPVHCKAYFTLYTYTVHSTLCTVRHTLHFTLTQVTVPCALWGILYTLHLHSSTIHSNLHCTASTTWWLVCTPDMNYKLAHWHWDKLWKSRGCSLEKLSLGSSWGRNPRKLPRDSFSRLPEAFHFYSDSVNPIGQSWTFKTLKSLKQKLKVAFRLSLGNSLEKLWVSRRVVWQW